MLDKRRRLKVTCSSLGESSWALIARPEPLDASDPTRWTSAWAGAGELPRRRLSDTDALRLLLYLIEPRKESEGDAGGDASGQLWIDLGLFVSELGTSATFPPSMTVGLCAFHNSLKKRPRIKFTAP